MEKQIKIPLGNKKFIYGTLNGSLKDPLLIFVHGFTGNRNEHIFFNGARFFTRENFSVFRFDLYSWKKDARKLEECTLSLHAQDLDRVVGFFKKKGVQRAYAIGHSFGGLTILLSEKQEFDKAVLWDPSIDPEDEFKYQYIKELDFCYLREEAAYGLTISKAFIEEHQNLKPKKMLEGFKKPVKIILAGKGPIKKKWKEFYNWLKVEKEKVEIKGASHCFDEEGTEERLFTETFKWLKG